MIELRDPEAGRKHIDEIFEELEREPSKEIEFIDAGVLNYVYRVTTEAGEVLYFKQALEQTKSQTIGTILRNLPPTRLQTEAKVIDILSDDLPDGVTIPRLLHYDEENNIVVMSDVRGEQGELLQTVLVEGRFDPRAAYNLGAFAGASHASTYGLTENLRGQSSVEEFEYWEEWLRLRTTDPVQNADPAVQGVMQRLYDRTMTFCSLPMLINLDICPKNSIVKPDGTTSVFDFELAVGVGDPANDLGFLLGHYALMSAIHNNPDEATESLREMMRGYFDAAGTRFLDAGFENRTLTTAGNIFLYRTAGQSPAPYIPKGRVADLQATGTDIVLGNVQDIGEVVDILVK